MFCGSYATLSAPPCAGPALLSQPLRHTHAPPPPPCNATHGRVGVRIDQAPTFCRRYDPPFHLGRPARYKSSATVVKVEVWDVVDEGKPQAPAAVKPGLKMHGVDIPDVAALTLVRWRSRQ